MQLPRPILWYRPTVPVSRLRGRPFDPAATLGILLGLAVCVPVITGVLAILCGVTVCRASDASRGELVCGVLSIILGVLNLSICCMAVMLALDD